MRGIGIDIASIPRMSALVERYGLRFVGRWFDASEFVEPPGPTPLQVASRFAAKEAVWKALRVEGEAPLPWRRIVITPQAAKDRHSVRLEGELGRTAAILGIGPISVSTQVLGDLVIAIAVAEEAEPQ